MQNRRMELLTRQVQQGDRPIFEQLHAAYLNEGGPGHREAPAGWVDTIYSQALGGERYLWIAQMGQESVGFCSFRVMPFFRDAEETFANVQDFYIVPSVRGRGLGRQLAKLVTRQVEELGAVSIELDVSADNAAGMQFWQRMGFKLRSFSLEMPIRNRGPRSA
jgi:ribosomal protein S18 acetylase RimI-like enzyme